jgi:hypothetical protein
LHNKHYIGFDYEPLDFILKFDLNFVEGSFLKYITRYERKGEAFKDLDKANFYYRGETGGTQYTMDAVRNRTNDKDFRFELFEYCNVNGLNDWQNEALFNYFTRKFVETDRAISKLKKSLREYKEHTEKVERFTFSSGLDNN